MSLMDMRASLIGEIEAFVAATGLAESSLGSLAVKDSRTVARIRSGGGVSLTTIERLRVYMRSEVARRRERRRRSSASDSEPIPETGVVS